jgi:hypothetical protein
MNSENFNHAMNAADLPIWMVIIKSQNRERAHSWFFTKDEAFAQARMLSKQDLLYAGDGESTTGGAVEQVLVAAWHSGQDALVDVALMCYCD